jgi:hypothetical protein
MFRLAGLLFRLAMAVSLMAPIPATPVFAPTPPPRA